MPSIYSDSLDPAVRAAEHDVNRALLVVEVGAQHLRRAVVKLPRGNPLGDRARVVLAAVDGLFDEDKLDG